MANRTRDPKQETNKVYFRHTILALFFTLLFVVVVGATLAYNNAYVTGTITFRGKITAEVTDFTFNNINYAETEMIPEDYTLWPGACVSGVTLKVKASRSETINDPDEIRDGLAYARVRFEVHIDDERLERDDMAYLKYGPKNDWRLIEFQDGIWYVLCDSDGNPKALKNNQAETFTSNNYLYINKDLTNQYASKQISVKFTVECLQRKNVEPSKILTGNHGGPYWQVPTE